MRELTREADLPDIEIVERGGDVVVRFRRSVLVSEDPNVNAVVSVLTQSPGMVSTGDIHERSRVGVSVRTVRRILDRLESEGVVVSESRGLHKLWGIRRKGGHLCTDQPLLTASPMAIICLTRHRCFAWVVVAIFFSVAVYRGLLRLAQ